MRAQSDARAALTGGLLSVFGALAVLVRNPPTTAYVLGSPAKSGHLRRFMTHTPLATVWIVFGTPGY